MDREQRLLALIYEINADMRWDLNAITQFGNIDKFWMGRVAKWQRMLGAELLKPNTCESDAPPVATPSKPTNAASKKRTERLIADASYGVSNTATGMPELLALQRLVMVISSELMGKGAISMEDTLTISYVQDPKSWKADLLLSGKIVSVSWQI